MINRVCVPFLSLSLWFVLQDILNVSSLLPTVKEVVIELLEVGRRGDLLGDLMASGGRWLPALIVGVGLGTGLGALLAISLFLRKNLEMPLEFLRAIPVSALFPLFLLLFGVGERSKILMISLPVFLNMAANVGYGLAEVETTRRAVVKSLGGSEFEVLWYVVRFEAIEYILIGLKLSVSLSLVVTLVVEMFIGCELGLGQRIYESYLVNSPGLLFGYIFVVGMIGVAIVQLIKLLEKRIWYWR